MTTTDRRYGVAEGLAVKAPCRVATTESIAHIGLQVIDGVQLVEGDRVLDKDNADATLCGIWVASSGVWTRAADFDGNRDIVYGTRVFVGSGDTQAAGEFYVSTANPIVIGTSSIAFTALANAALLANQAEAEAASDNDKLMTSLRVRQQVAKTVVRQSLLRFGNAYSEMQKDESVRDLSSAMQEALASGEPILIPPGRMPFHESIANAAGDACGVYLNADTPVDVLCANGAEFVIPANWTPPGTTTNFLDLRTPVSPNPATGAMLPFSWVGGKFDASAYTAENGKGSVTGMSLMSVYRYWKPQFKNIIFDGGVTEHTALAIGYGAVDQLLDTHQTFGDDVEGCTFIGAADLGYYPSGANVQVSLGNDPITTNHTTGTHTLAWSSHGLSVGHKFILSGATAVGGIASFNREFTVTGVPSVNAVEFELAGASSSATGGGNAVLAANLTYAENFGRGFRGLAFSARYNTFYRCRRAGSAKRNWNGYSYEGNLVYECDFGFTSQAGGDVGGEGTAAFIIGNRLFFIQTTAISLFRGSANFIRGNHIENVGKQLYDPSQGTNSAEAIELYSAGRVICTDNVLVQTAWAGSGIPGFPIGIRLLASATGADGPTDGFYAKNLIDGYDVAVSAAAGARNLWDNLIRNQGGSSVYGTNDIVLTPGDTSLAYSVDLIVPDEAYGSAWNGKLSVPTKNAIYDAVNEGRWTPTITAVANVASSTGQSSHYIRIGNHVMCWGEVTVQATAAAATLTSIGISLPVPTNLTSGRDLAGVATAYNTSNSAVGNVSGDTSNERAQIDYLSPTTASIAIKFSFSYEIKS